MSSIKSVEVTRTTGNSDCYYVVVDIEKTEYNVVMMKPLLHRHDGFATDMGAFYRFSEYFTSNPVVDCILEELKKLLANTEPDEDENYPTQLLKALSNFWD
jgi:hypothetical protein